MTLRGMMMKCWRSKKLRRWRRWRRG